MSSISSTNPVSNLASQLFTAADGNSDGRLSATEFQSFLQQLLGNLTTHQTSDLGTESSSVKPHARGRRAREPTRACWVSTT